MRRLVPIIVIVLGFAGCRHSETTGCRPEDFGYHESYLDRQLVEHAVQKADTILDPGLGLSFLPSWSSSQRSGRTISVFLVDAQDLPLSDLARSPGSLDCLFISSAFGPTMTALFGKEADGTLDVDQTEALTVILLHEAGHFRFGDAGEYGTPVPVNADTLPVQVGEDKNKELRADRFAGDQIRGAVASTGERQRIALSLLLSLTNVGWDLFRHRLIDNFAATTLNLPSAFGDLNYSHPNLELRFLIINYTATRHATSLQLLQNFLDGRKSSETTSGVLYRRSQSVTGQENQPALTPDLKFAPHN